MLFASSSYKTYPSAWREIIGRPLISAFAIFFIAIHVAFVFAFHFAPEQLSVLTIEDGLLENMSALMYLISSILFGVVVVRYSNGLVRLWAVFFAIGFLVFAGEEASWGQRFFGYHVESVEAINAQGEFNIHNLENLMDSKWLNPGRLLTLASIGFGVLLPIALSLSRRFRYLVDGILQFPMPHPVVGIGFVLSWIWYRGYHGKIDTLEIAVEESRETTIALAFFVFVIIVFLNLQALGAEKKRSQSVDSV